jgi:hypothetical protein
MMDQYSRSHPLAVGGALAVTEDENSVFSVHSNEINEERGGNGPDEHQGDSNIAAKETKAVQWIRAVAIAVIVCSTLGVALSVFYYMTNTEKETFANRFKADSYKILESIGSTLDRSLGSVDAYAVGLVSLAEQSNQTWPYVAAAHFPIQSSKILTLSKGILFSTYCYVENKERESWYRYAINNDGWVDESLDVQEKALNKTYFGPIRRNWSRPDDIYRDFEDTFESDFYMVQWQQYPVIPGDVPSYGWDYWEFPGAEGERMFETHKAVISSSSNLPDLDDPVDVAFHNSYAEFLRKYLPPGRDSYEPYIEIYYVRYCDICVLFRERSCFLLSCNLLQPLLNKTDSIQTENPEDYQFLGFVSVTIYWRDLISNLLPPGSDGIIIVFENECNPTFSFQVYGPKVQYLGRGDFHDPKYESLKNGVSKQFSVAKWHQKFFSEPCTLSLAKP